MRINLLRIYRNADMHFWTFSIIQNPDLSINKWKFEKLLTNIKRIASNRTEFN